MLPCRTAFNSMWRSASWDIRLIRYRLVGIDRSRDGRIKHVGAKPSSHQHPLETLDLLRRVARIGPQLLLRDTERHLLHQRIDILGLQNGPPTVPNQLPDDKSIARSSSIRRTRDGWPPLSPSPKLFFLRRWSSGQPASAAFSASPETFVIRLSKVMGRGAGAGHERLDALLNCARVIAQIRLKLAKLDVLAVADPQTINRGLERLLRLPSSSSAPPGRSPTAV